MLTITLENFKGISAPVTISIRPLTIMFGKNSAGKSTVVQALHYAREVFESSNFNADRTEIGGSAVDLGGFLNLVNNHSPNKVLRIRFDLDISSWEPFPRYENLDFINHYSQFTPSDDLDNEAREYLKTSVLTSEILVGRDLSEKFNKLVENAEFDESGQVSVEFSVQWSETLEKPVLTHYQTWISGEPAGRIQTALDEKSIIYEINANHRLLWDDEDLERNSEPIWQQLSILWSGSGKYTSLPQWGIPLYVFPNSETGNSSVGHQTVSQMIVAPGDLVRSWLNKFRYLGPLREIPPRSFQPSLTENKSDWANGLAAWRELYTDDSLAELWVSSEGLHRLKTGYYLKVYKYREIPADSNFMYALENNTVFDDIADTGEEIKKYPLKKKIVLVEERSGLEVAPHDVGVGISQVVPVIVAAFSFEPRIIAIEQPELHLHPAIQAELGDLFIQAAIGDFTNFFLLETHSEHLILRILRRIRECAEGDIENTGSPQIKPDHVQLMYIEPTKDGTVFYDLPITEEGDFAETVPGGFFAERAKELF